MTPDIAEWVPVLVFFISFYGLITGKSILKSIASLTVMNGAIVMLFLGMDHSPGLLPPIGQGLANPADPLPQSLVITAIIMGVAMTAINLVMVISLCRQYNTTDWDQIKKKITE